MGGQAQSQGNPVYYDNSSNQYYTETPKNNSPFAGLFGNMIPNEAFANYKPSGDLFSDTLYSLFAPSGQRTYLNNFNQRQQAEQSPYQYADTSLSALFPSSNLVGAGLSGAGRFVSGAPIENWMANMTPQGNYVNSYVPSAFVMPAETTAESLIAPQQITAQNLGGSLSSGSGVWANLGK